MVKNITIPLLCFKIHSNFFNISNIYKNSQYIYFSMNHKYENIH